MKKMSLRDVKRKNVNMKKSSTKALSLSLLFAILLCLLLPAEAVDHSDKNYTVFATNMDYEDLPIQERRS